MKSRRPALDIRRIARGLAQQGNDLRHWVSYATVATTSGDDGEPNVADPSAILVTPAGVEVDLILEPSGYPCTARYGIAAGSCHINAPIRPGDQVIVGIPDGDVSMVPQVFCVISGSSDPMPVGGDGRPIFQNDRLMIHAGDGIPIEVRTNDGTMVRLMDQSIDLGGGATEQNMLGTTYRSNEDDMLTTWKLLMQTAAGACHAATNPATTMAAVQAVGVMLDGMVQALSQFQLSADQYLSQVVKSK